MQTFVVPYVKAEGERLQYALEGPMVNNVDKIAADHVKQALLVSSDLCTSLELADWEYPNVFIMRNISLLIPCNILMLVGDCRFKPVSKNERNCQCINLNQNG